MNAEVQNVTLTVDKFYSFLHIPFHLNFLKSAKLPDPVINVRNVITNLQIGEFFQRDGLFFCVTVL